MNTNTAVPKIGLNFLHWFSRYGIHKVFGSLPAVTLTFDLLTQKSNQQSIIIRAVERLIFNRVVDGVIF